MAQEAQDTTVVGVFDDYAAAERVAQDLTNAGISRNSIDVRSNFRTGAAGRGYDESEHEGGISGFFHRLFGSEHTDASHYDEAVRRGNSVVAVTGAPDQIEQAVEIMNSAGAIDIERRVEQYRGTGYDRYDPNAPAYSFDEAVAERERFRGKDEGGSIPVIEEELQVGKRTVRSGGVRVYSRVVDQPVEQNIELREERVRVDRRPADRPVDARELSALRDQTIEVQEITEEPVVQKRARVREEVVVGKESKRRTEKVRDTVRRTEVEVERLGGEDRRADALADDDYRADFRRDWDTRYATSGEAYETYEPAYEYGYRSASDDRWRGRSWSEVEPELRSDYERRYPGSAWERMKDSIRYGWNKVTGRR
jgi:uncharacterized protein (TIGR02271 family)